MERMRSAAIVIFEIAVGNQDARKQAISYDIHDIGVSRLEWLLFS